MAMINIWRRVFFWTLKILRLMLAVDALAARLPADPSHPPPPPGPHALHRALRAEGFDDEDDSGDRPGGPQQKIRQGRHTLPSLRPLQAGPHR